MNGRLWGGRRADAFQDALDGQVDLTEYELTEFVRLAHALREMAPATLGNEARSSMRARLVAEAETVLGGATVPPPPLRKPKRRKLRIAAGSTAAVAAISAGLVTMSADALPGDVLYPIKRGVEQVELTVGGGGAAGTGQTRLDHAAERLDEAEQLARGGKADRVGGVLDDFSSDAEAGTEQLLRAYASDGNDAQVEEIRAFANASADRLRAIAPMLGSSSRSSLQAAIDTVTSIDRRAVAVCPACAGGPTVQVPFDPEHLGSLPERDPEDTDEQQGDSSHDDVVAEPDDLPNGTDLPDLDPTPDKNGADDSDHDDTDSGDNDPQLEGDSVVGSDQSDSVRPDDDDSTGHDLPDLPDLPGIDEKSGSIVESLPLGPVHDVLDPVQTLIDQLGPIGDLLSPVLGSGNQSDKDGKTGKNGKNDDRPLEDLLGPVVGQDDADADDRDSDKPDADLDPTQDTTTDDEDDGEVEGEVDGDTDDSDGLIDGVTGTNDAPPVEEEDLDPLENGATDGATGE